VAGATASRAMAGFSAHHVVHTTKIEVLTEHLPVRIEFIESEQKVQEILPALCEMVSDGLIEVQDTLIIKSAMKEKIVAASIYSCARPIRVVKLSQSISSKNYEGLKPDVETEGRIYRMKNRIILGGAVTLLALLASAWAADLAGKWTAQAGGVEITLIFKVDGTTLTGTVNNPQGGEAAIKEGKIDGDEISFYVVRKINDIEVKVMWKGTASGDEIKFKREVQGGGGPGGGNSMDILAKRVSR
jgi:hypothetical protein